jgi:hypothetical protein
MYVMVGYYDNNDNNKNTSELDILLPREWEGVIILGVSIVQRALSLPPATQNRRRSR